MVKLLNHLYGYTEENVPHAQSAKGECERMRELCCLISWLYMGYRTMLLKLRESAVYILSSEVLQWTLQALINVAGRACQFSAWSILSMRVLGNSQRSIRRHLNIFIWRFVNLKNSTLDDPEML